MLRLPRFAWFAWGVLGYNLLVILWGALVRATGSGAGCGSHWPLCNGEVIPPDPAIETLIEFTHRLTSGVALLAVLGMCIWAWRLYPARHIVRRAAGFSLFFIIIEALLGAGLVLFELVAHNASLTRAFSMAAHLANTFLLIGALTLTAWWAGGAPRPQIEHHRRWAVQLVIGMVGLLLVGMSGAITALGDTLFVAYTAAGDGEQALPPLVQVLIRLRVFHPLIAVLVGLYTVLLAWSIQSRAEQPATRKAAIVLSALFIIQLIAGFVNVLLMVPIWMQLVHLLLADLVWIALILLGAAALAEPLPATDQGRPALGRGVAEGA
ncbi:MAG TPA: COX15/CtaA family protein [Roseiflexaceae bacterium]|nr:COX15/CtaA family protein [Roseiflexaceae bacterium]HMP39109.1 COX15/CtaA family protein [Roseiflexaceae bacterium]